MTLIVEVFYNVNNVNLNYSVKNSTVDCKYLHDFLQEFVSYLSARYELIGDFWQPASTCIFLILKVNKKMLYLWNWTRSRSLDFYPFKLVLVQTCINVHIFNSESVQKKSYLWNWTRSRSLDFYPFKLVLVQLKQYCSTI
jgi:hypothetical protein